MCPGYLQVSMIKAMYSNRPILFVNAAVSAVRPKNALPAQSTFASKRVCFQSCLSCWNSQSRAAPRHSPRISLGLSEWLQLSPVKFRHRLVQTSTQLRSNYRFGMDMSRAMSTMTASDTIFALSSGAGVTAGVAVLRISGPDAQECVRKMLKGESHLPEPRFASLRRLHHPKTREVLDHALVLFFPGPRSFTGEDVVELHVHGSRAVVAAVTNALGATRARPAGRGEFTRRAFENGRMDLTEVEGLSDLIAADTDEQRRQALRQLRGDLRLVYEGWRERIKECLAHAEAVIDFGDDVDDDAFEAVLPRVIALRDEMMERLNDDRRGEIVRSGVQVAIVGPPNVGKSTLLNILAGRPAAIVSPHAGTTRDIVEVSLDFNGIPVVVRDTAGLRDNTEDAIELEGMRRARHAAASADVMLFVQDASTESFRFDHGELAVWGIETDCPRMAADSPQECEAEVGIPPICLVVANKADLSESAKIGRDADREKMYITSFKSGDGVEVLLKDLELAIRRRVEGDIAPNEASTGATPDAPVITRARHRHHVERTVEALQAFVSGRSGPLRAHYLPMDLATEELRIASRELGAITGVIHVEEVLDVIFNDFCIGK